MTPAELLEAYREASRHETTWEMILLDPRTTPDHYPIAEKYFKEVRAERLALEKQLTEALTQDTTP